MSHDALRDTWIYVDIRREVQEEIQQQQLDEQRRMLLAIVQARFPRIEALARRIAEAIIRTEVLRDLIVKTGAARTEKEARESITAGFQDYMQVVEKT